MMYRLTTVNETGPTKIIFLKHHDLVQHLTSHTPLNLEQVDEMLIDKPRQIDNIRTKTGVINVRSFPDLTESGLAVLRMRIEGLQYVRGRYYGKQDIVDRFLYQLVDFATGNKKAKFVLDAELWQDIKVNDHFKREAILGIITKEHDVKIESKEYRDHMSWINN